MKLQRFIVDVPLDRRQVIISDAELLNQLQKVFRLRTGDKVILADGKLTEAIAQIRNINKNLVELEVLSVSKNQNEPNQEVILYCAILKRENFELVAQKATEVGVKEIVPLLTERTVKLNLNLERLKKIIKEAAEQSGRGVLPVLHSPMDFEKALEHSKKNDINLFFDLNGQRMSELNPRKSVRTGIWIGSEGGWDEKELALVKERNFSIVSLGKLTLRSETAAIIASYLTTLL